MQSADVMPTIPTLLPRVDTPVAIAAREADQYRIEYYMHSRAGTLDGGAFSYITKTESYKPMQEFPDLDCLKPNVVLLDDWQKDCSTLFFVIPKEKYELMYRDDLVSVSPRLNMTANFSNGRSAVLTRRAYRGLELNAYSADGYQIYYSENGDKFKKLTTVSGKQKRTVKYTIGDTEKFKIRPYKKVNECTMPFRMHIFLSIL